MRTTLPAPTPPATTGDAQTSQPHTPSAPATRARRTPPAPALLDQHTATTLLHVWTGQCPAVVVESPPGAGKTELVITVAHQLVQRAGFAIAVAAQTRDQARAVANRAASRGVPVTLLTGRNDTRPRDLDPAVSHAPGERFLHDSAGIVVATTDRWIHTDPTRMRPDLLIVDEAYQMTYAKLGALGALTDQVLLVGDPGQIDPVVTAPTQRWDTWAAGPHQPAPLALAAAHPKFVTELQLDRSWRLGPDTTALLQPVFYPQLPFTSGRGPRSLVLNGAPLPEYTGVPIDPVSKDDPLIARAAADRVRELLTYGRLDVPDPARGTSPQAPRPLAASQVAVLAPHVSQVALIAALLADEPDVLVASINAAQGLERDAVVVVHPLAGYREAQPFALDSGRLCVALSRHRTHVTVLTDQHSPTVLRRALADGTGSAAAETHLTVLERLASPLSPSKE